MTTATEASTAIDSIDARPTGTRWRRRPRRPFARSPIYPLPPRMIAIVGLVLGIGVLWVARTIFVPLALAILLAFLLNPLVVQVRRTGLGRGAAVAVVVALALCVALAVGWALWTQISALVDDLPRYRQTISRKITDIQRAQRGGTLDKVERTAADVAKQLEGEAARGASVPKPIPVVVTRPSALWRIPEAVEVLGTAALVVVLLFFMLIQRRELLARIVRLFGPNRLALATRALEEAGERISHYMVMQSLVNSGFGAVVALGLFLLGVPFALVWGVFAALLRFIPYVGAWVAASVPIVLSLVLFEGWTKPLSVLGLYVVSEAVIAFVLEPLLYRRSVGVSEIALLLAAAFWAWLWGPIGLLLSTPLTVCLVVVARNVSGLEFIGLLLSDDTGVPRHIIYYQRLLAGDEVEAAELAAEVVRKRSLEAAFDGVLMPALSRAQRDHGLGRLTPDEYERILGATAALVARLDAPEGEGRPDLPPPDPAPGILVIAGCPVGDEADRIALTMLDRLLPPDALRMSIAPAGGLVSETVAFVQELSPALICVGSLGVSRFGRVRHLVKRLRAAAPEVPILVGRWGAPRVIGDRQALWAAGASEVATSIAEARREAARIASARAAGLDPSRHARVP
jgi:predicted PurR-regulated permease PerM